ncbi:MAG TPA: methionyl-tRNA formyltransferase [Chloroflexota bacterium]|nr:methionyl-tRNA formyltransferase [Chloroflexota bacterium]
MTGAFSVPPLERLIAAGVDVCGAVVPAGAEGPAWAQAPAPEARSMGLPVLTPYVQRNIVQLAWERGLPVFETADLRSPAAEAAVRELAPDVIVVACFDRLIPHRVHQLARLAVNVHPSLLPENRGPAPLFWTFRLGLKETGVTIHLLDDRPDAGDILAQARVLVPEGVEPAQLERQLAEIGGRLLLEVLRQFEAGTLHPQPQDESKATYHGWPDRVLY